MVFLLNVLLEVVDYSFRTHHETVILQMLVFFKTCFHGFVVRGCACPLFSLLGSDSLPSRVNFYCRYFLFYRKISKMLWLIGTKCCTVISTKPNFIMPVQHFGGLPPKNFRGQKHAKFGQISDDFEVWRRISPEWIKIFKVRLRGFIP